MVLKYMRIGCEIRMLTVFNWKGWRIIERRWKEGTIDVADRIYLINFYRWEYRGIFSLHVYPPPLKLNLA